MTVMWFNTDCPNCKASNWIYYGDPEDMTFCENPHVQCFKCKHCFSIDPYFEEELTPDDCGLGKETPL